jgi:hypothetical protein
VLSRFFKTFLHENNSEIVEGCLNLTIGSKKVEEKVPKRTSKENICQAAEFISSKSVIRMFSLNKIFLIERMISKRVSLINKSYSFYKYCTLPGL